MRLRARLRSLDPNVRNLGVVSFLADVSSEIAYPLFPLFVTTVLGAPVAVLGLIEGIAEATASITKYPFGQAADYTGRRRPFVLGGYTLGSLGKLVIALAAGWPLALAGRFVDRFGKGMRTASRDDLIAAGTRPEQQGLAFGLHRTMDTLGAVLGPLVALALVQADVPLRWIFAIAVIPGLLSVLAILLLVQGAPGGAAAHRLPPVAARLAGLPLAAGRLAAVRGRQLQRHVHPAEGQGRRPGHERRHPAVRALQRHVLGRLAAARRPQRPRRPVSRSCSPATPCSPPCTWASRRRARASVMAVLFAAYGLYIAATEGTSKALIGRAIPTGERASALGLYYTATGLAGFAASTVGGLLWSAVGPWATFAFGAAAALAAAALMLLGHGRVRRDAGG